MSELEPDLGAGPEPVMKPSTELQVKLELDPRSISGPEVLLVLQPDLELQLVPRQMPEPEAGLVLKLVPRSYAVSVLEVELPLESKELKSVQVSVLGLQMVHLTDVVLVP